MIVEKSVPLREPGMNLTHSPSPETAFISYQLREQLLLDCVQQKIYVLLHARKHCILVLAESAGMTGISSLRRIVALLPVHVAQSAAPVSRAHLGHIVSHKTDSAYDTMHIF